MDALVAAEALFHARAALRAGDLMTARMKRNRNRIRRTHHAQFGASCIRRRFCWLWSYSRQRLPRSRRPVHSKLKLTTLHTLTLTLTPVKNSQT